MKKIKILTLIIMIALSACNKKDTNNPFINNKLNKAWLNEIIRKSDSTYNKPYFRSDFVTANYYVNKKDSTRCQIMRDSSKTVRQILIEKNGTRIFYSRFYTNGQAEAIVSLNRIGQQEGKAELFFENGKIWRKGDYYNGLYIGEWQEFDVAGNLINKEVYDSSGQVVTKTNF